MCAAKINIVINKEKIILSLKINNVCAVEENRLLIIRRPQVESHGIHDNEQ